MAKSESVKAKSLNRSLLERVAARVSDWQSLDRTWAMATMISPNRAVTVIPGGLNKPLEILLPRQTYESTAVQILTRDEELGFTVLGLMKEFHSLNDLEISVGATIAGPCTTLSFSPDVPDGEIVEGKIAFDGPRPFVRFGAKVRIAPGAPIVALGAIVGIVGVDTMIEMSLLRSLPAAVAMGFTEPKLLDFRALVAEAAVVFDHAVGIAMWIGVSKVHMEHLLLALSVTGALPVPFADLRSSLDFSDKFLPADYTPATRGHDHIAMPQVSSHVETALSNAVLIAAARGADRVSSADLIDGVLQLTDCSAVDTLRSHGVGPLKPVVSAATSTAVSTIAGYLSDAATANNHLGFAKQAYDLCTVLAAKAVKPPLSVGLFGDWGAGKSSFMKLMEVQFRRIEESSNRNPNSAFCKRIVHLWFNAWHYIDDNLYAGIAREIFEGLGFALTATEKQATAEELAFQRRAAELEEKSALESWQAAVATSTQRERELQKTQQTIEKLNIDPKALEDALTSAEVIVEVTSFASGDAEVKNSIERAAARIHYPREEAGELLANVHSTFDALRQLLAIPKNRARSTIWVLLGLGAIFMGVSFRALTYVGGVIGGATLISYAVWLSAAARAAAQFVDRARKREAEIVEAKKKSLKIELDRQTDALKFANEDTDAKATVLNAARERVLAAQPERRMASFIRERLTAWQKDAGVIAAAHRDFRELSRFLQRVASTSVTTDGKALPPIDRIVLYIDDLDRCPEDKVFQVLQAVHLLLAFDLFVVVVAVDSRWLLESVRKSTKRSEDDAHSTWRTTPQNYLEKIFQIPYTLDPMPSEHFGTFVRSLTSTLADERTTTPSTEGSTAPKTTETGEEDSTSEEPNLETIPEPDKDYIQEEGLDVYEYRAFRKVEWPSLEAAANPEPAIDPAPEHLTFEEHEVDFTIELYPFMSSPRNTKRFVNVYRLLRATLEPAELAAIRDARTGAHQAPQILIAIITNQHEIAPKFCSELRAATEGASWETFSNGFFPEKSPHGDAIRALHKSNRALAGRKMKELQGWLPRVARYSFEMGRLVNDSV